MTSLTESPDDPPRRRRRPLVTVVAIVVIVLLVGGTLVGVLGLGGSQTAPTPEVAASGTPRPADPALVPAYPEAATPAAVGTETTRLGDAIVGRIDPAAILNDDEFAEEIPATATEPGYFGVLHTLTLDPSVPPGAQADELVARLGEAGWTTQDAAEEDGITRVVLVSGTDPATSWLALIGADASVPGQSVVSVQLASPNLP